MTLPASPPHRIQDPFLTPLPPHHHLPHSPTTPATTATASAPHPPSSPAGPHTDLVAADAAVEARGTAYWEAVKAVTMTGMTYEECAVGTDVVFAVAEREGVLEDEAGSGEEVVEELGEEVTVGDVVDGDGVQVCGAG
ncbi:hypothetical protein MMC15_001536 [Xylographa vitiligo]|nr:hypothetical protein [Xylographa vitiligo]